MDGAVGVLDPSPSKTTFTGKKLAAVEKHIQCSLATTKCSGMCTYCFEADVVVLMVHIPWFGAVFGMTGSS